MEGTSRYSEKTRSEDSPSGRVFVGRGEEGVAASVFERGWLGNPFSGNPFSGSDVTDAAMADPAVTDANETGGDWDEVLTAYGAYLRRRMEADEAFRRAVIGVVRGNAVMVGENGRESAHSCRFRAALRRVAENADDGTGPTLQFGDMWDVFPWHGGTDAGTRSGDDVERLFLITTNAVVRRGRLVMGAGIADQARQRFPGIDERLGSVLIRRGEAETRYGLLVSEEWPRRPLGLFQTKIDYREPSPLDMIEQSASELEAWLFRQKSQGMEVRVDLPFPGVGCGGRSMEEVWRVVMDLPPDVHIWQFPDRR